MYNRYGESAYEDGYRIYTTITHKVQQAAQQAVRNNVLDYDMRHGYRGPANVLWKVGESAWDNNKITDTLKALPTYGPLLPAAVTSANPQEATAMLADGSTVVLSMEGVRWARPYRSDTQQGPTPRKVTDVLQTGQQIWVRQVDDAWWLAQVPEVNSALVSINPQNGAVMALVGGFDFNQSKFNRATRALRQVGSNIKPFLYTAAMDKGLTLASMLNDVPISRWDAGAGSDWQPKNSPPQYAGPPAYVRGWVSRKRGDGTRNAGDGRRLRCRISATLRLPGTKHCPHRIAGAGFSFLHPNAGGARLRGHGERRLPVDPWFISKIENDQGGVIFEAKPKVACPECDIPVIYGDTQKSNVLENNDVEDVAISREQQNVSVPMPQLEQANQALVAKTGAQEYAPHVINTPLAFLIKSALNTNILVNRAGRVLAGEQVVIYNGMI